MKITPTFFILYVFITLVVLSTMTKAFSAQPPLLVDPMTKRPITSIDDWMPRRQAIIDFFRDNVYGRVPDTPFNVESKITFEDAKALDGKATLQIVELTLSTASKKVDSFTFPFTLYIPNNQATQPCPAIVLICNRSRDIVDPLVATTTTDSPGEYWPVEVIVDAGFATAAFWASDVDPDDQDDRHDNGIHPLLDQEKGRFGDSWGCIAAWAFGASRIVDHLNHKSCPKVDGSKVAVVGHSRGGKTALWAACIDSRFGLAISNNSGCTGAALSRRKANGRHGETIQQINDTFPNWFCTNYRQYNGREHVLPFDQHALLAAIAPRAVYVASATRDDWADARGEYLSAVAAAPVWQLWQNDDEKTTTNLALPSHAIPEQPIFRHQWGYHLRTGHHDMLLYDWQQYLTMARQVFGRVSTPSACQGDIEDVSCVRRGFAS